MIMKIFSELRFSIEKFIFAFLFHSELFLKFMYIFKNQRKVYLDIQATNLFFSILYRLKGFREIMKEVRSLLYLWLILTWSPSDDPSLTSFPTPIITWNNWAELRIIPEHYRLYLPFPTIKGLLYKVCIWICTS